MEGQNAEASVSRMLSRSQPAVPERRIKAMGTVETYISSGVCRIFEEGVENLEKDTKNSSLLKQRMPGGMEGSQK